VFRPSPNRSEIDALSFGNGGTAGPVDTLFFAAGIDDEQHGLLATLTPE